MVYPGANQDITVLSPTFGPRDAEGRRTQSLEEQMTVRGNLFEDSTRELVDGQWTTVATWEARLPAGTPVSSESVLRDDQGNEYRVTAVRPRRGPSGGVFLVSCSLERVA